MEESNFCELGMTLCDWGGDIETWRETTWTMPSKCVGKKIFCVKKKPRRRIPWVRVAVEVNERAARERKR